MAMLFVEHGVNLNSINEHDCNALMIAAQAGQERLEQG